MPGGFRNRQLLGLLMFDLRDLLIYAIGQIPLCDAAREIAILLQPQHRPQESHAYDAEEGRKQMPGEHDPMSDVREDELDKLRGLVEVFLLGDIVERFLPFARRVVAGAVGGEIQHGCQRYWCDMERHKPN